MMTRQPLFRPSWILAIHIRPDLAGKINEYAKAGTWHSKWIIAWGGGRLIPMSSPKARFIGCGTTQPGQPLNDGEFEVTCFAHDASIV
jgi:hypothetical protein